MKRNLVLLVVVLAPGLASFLEAQAAPSPGAQLKQLVEELQKNPGDDALRERIIKHARTVKPAPAIPEEARRFFVRGNALFKEAKAPADAAGPIGEYRNALKIAPWWGDAYYNLSRAQELAEKYDEAIKSLRFYLLTNPKDAREAQDHSYALEAKYDVIKRKRADAEKQAEIDRKRAKLDGLYQTVRQWNAWGACSPNEDTPVWGGCREGEGSHRWLTTGGQQCTLSGERFVCQPPPSPSGWPVQIIGIPSTSMLSDIEWQCDFGGGRVKTARSRMVSNGVIIECWRPKGESTDPYRRLPSLWLHRSS